MKAILKERHRYMLFDVIAGREFGKEAFRRALDGALLKILGELSFAVVAPRLISFDGKQGIVRTTTAGLEDLRTALALVTALDGVHAHVMAVFVSGTIKGLGKRRRPRLR